MKLSALKTSAMITALMAASSIASTDAYKLMIIDDGTLANFIELGKYKVALEASQSKQGSINDDFVSDVNRCVASIRLNDYQQAETLCSQAIHRSEALTLSPAQRKQFTAYALSNRAMARLELSKETAAIADLYEASKLSPSPHVEANLQTARVRLSLSD